ncbi:glutamine amidotransferase [Sphingomonas sp. Leaf22]|uniref:glutamine amidotransferase-related protein n=1 Tax=Sphingomonas sp. Leaf22 TaxID=1735687 RepID=UPI0006F7BBEF|nr:glutamine amidotransferase [Sphingomonas sp. Leaf22]KQM95259.1 glutamine amidotransferase [Sphingomonas sp. Leaf22]
MKSALIVRHVPYEGCAGYRAPVEAARYAIDRIDVTDPAFATADLTTPDLLIVMGGPMGVYDVAEHPWIPGEIAALSRRLAADRPTLGICLGAQMMAAAMGSDVYKGSGCEIGFAPVDLTPDLTSPLRHVAGVPVLHWHGDTFDLPDGTELLATTPRYRQGFRRGRNLLALQFHAEMGEDARFEAWLDYLDCPNHRGSLTEEYRTLGPAAVRAGQAMIGEWLAGLEG